jgi:hypothetical protein
MKILSIGIFNTYITTFNKSFCKYFLLNLLCDYYVELLKYHQSNNQICCFNNSTCNKLHKGQAHLTHDISPISCPNTTIKFGKHHEGPIFC